MAEQWVDAGSMAELQRKTLQQLELGKVRIALTYKDGEFSAVSGVCNHVGGPLGEGRLDGDYVTCPWHYWKFHCRTGLGEPGFEEDAVPRHDVKVETGACSSILFPRRSAAASRMSRTRWRARSCVRTGPFAWSASRRRR